MNESQINELIASEKIVVRRPKEVLVADKARPFILRNSFDCVSKDGHNFHVFMRKHAELPSIFSIGLILKTKDTGEINLVRFNCRQRHQNRIVNKDLFEDFHIHRASAKELAMKVKDFDAFVTKLYINYETAVKAFCKYCNLRDKDGQILFSNKGIPEGQISFEEVLND